MELVSAIENFSSAVTSLIWVALVVVIVATIGVCFVSDFLRQRGRSQSTWKQWNSR